MYNHATVNRYRSVICGSNSHRSLSLSLSLSVGDIVIPTLIVHVLTVKAECAKTGQSFTEALGLLVLPVYLAPCCLRCSCTSNHLNGSHMNEWNE
jgi:hypothetical protein